MWPSPMKPTSLALSFQRVGHHYRAAVNRRVDGHQLGSASAHHDRLDIDELLDAILRKLATITALLDTAEGEPRIGADVVVDEHIAALDLGGDALTARDIACDDAAAQSEHRITSRRDRGILVVDPDHRRHRAKQFFCISGHAFRHLRKDGWRIIGAGPPRNLAAEHAARALCDAALDLSMQRVPKIMARQRTDFSVLFERITHFGSGHAIDEEVDKPVVRL